MTLRAVEDGPRPTVSGRVPRSPVTAAVTSRGGSGGRGDAAAAASWGPAVVGSTGAGGLLEAVAVAVTVDGRGRRVSGERVERALGELVSGGHQTWIWWIVSTAMTCRAISGSAVPSMNAAP